MKEKKALGELFDSIKFLFDSKKGKYSLDTYLDIVSEYTDGIISDSVAEGLYYLGGECEVINNQKDSTYDFKLSLFFESKDTERIVKEASRSISKEKFTTETESVIGNRKKFEIDRPR